MPIKLKKSTIQEYLKRNTPLDNYFLHLNQPVLDLRFIPDSVINFNYLFFLPFKYQSTVVLIPSLSVYSGVQPK